MSEVKHIPGPYKYDPDNDRDDLQVRDARGSIIASVEDNRGYTLAQCQATAKLFSAAPDMLNALIDAKKHLEEYCFGDNQDRTDVYNNIVKAINKATGN